MDKEKAISKAADYSLKILRDATAQGRSVSEARSIEIASGRFAVNPKDVAKKIPEAKLRRKR